MTAPMPGEPGWEDWVAQRQGQERQRSWDAKQERVREARERAGRQACWRATFRQMPSPILADFMMAELAQTEHEAACRELLAVEPTEGIRPRS